MYTVQVTGANIELWQYKLFENGMLYLEEKSRQPTNAVIPETVQNIKNPVMIEACKKAVRTRLNRNYTIE
jgi:hypothetical protein